MSENTNTSPGPGDRQPITHEHLDLQEVHVYEEQTSHFEDEGYSREEATELARQEQAAIIADAEEYRRLIDQAESFGHTAGGESAELDQD